MRAAVESEERRVKEVEELAKTKERIIQARKIAVDEEVIGAASGMTIQELKDEDDGEDHGEVVPAKKAPERKTKKERRKAEKLRAEVWPLCPDLRRPIDDVILSRDVHLLSVSLRNACSHLSTPPSLSENRPTRLPRSGSAFA